MFLGDRVREARTAAGLTWEGLANEAGISVRTVAYIESRQVNPRQDTLEKIAAACGVDMGFFEPWLAVKPLASAYHRAAMRRSFAS